MSPILSPMADALLTGRHRLELVLVRHGQQLPPEERVEPAHRTDPPLTGLGERQIEAVAGHLSTDKVTAVYTSTLDRARRTGEAIAARHDLDVTELHELREIELMRHLPRGMTPREALGEVVLAGAGTEFVRTRRWDAFPLAETGPELRRRVMTAMEGILAAHDDGRVVVACHGGVINAYVAEILGIAMDMFFRPAHCSVHRLLVGDDRRVVSTLNEVHHLGDELFSS